MIKNDALRLVQDWVSQGFVACRLCCEGDTAHLDLCRTEDPGSYPLLDRENGISSWALRLIVQYGPLACQYLVSPLELRARAVHG